MVLVGHLSLNLYVQGGMVRVRRMRQSSAWTYKFNLDLSSLTFCYVVMMLRMIWTLCP